MRTPDGSGVNTAVGLVVPTQPLHRIRRITVCLPKMGRSEWQNSRCIFLTKNNWESMEKQLNLIAIFSQDFRNCTFFKNSRQIWREGTFDPKSSRTGCSMTLIGKD